MHSYNSNHDFDYMLKFIILGDTSVGKSSLLSRFTDNVFHNQNYPTIGVDFKIANFTLKNEKTAKVSIWDTAGQERFRTIVRSYYKGVQGCLLVYDVTNRETWEDIKGWVEELKENCPNYNLKESNQRGGSHQQKLSVILVGNKNDDLNREVSYEEGRRLAEQIGASFIETSAKSGKNVDSAFRDLTENIVEAIEIKRENQNLQGKSKKIGIGIGGNDLRQKTESTCC